MNDHNNNSMSDKDRADYVDACHRYLLNQLNPAEFEQLQQALQTSPEVRAEFLRAVTIDAELQAESLRRHSEPTVMAKGTVSRWKRALPWIAGVAAVAVVSAVAFWGLAKPSSSTPDLDRKTIATLIDVKGCQWDQTPQLALNDRLTAGPVILSAGVALFEFDDGARLALEGPATLELSTASAARLTFGSASVRCEDGSEGFMLATPSAKVIDLGTEFGVSVGNDGATAVEVLDGEVEIMGIGVSNKDSTGNRFLTAGQMVKVNAEGTQISPAKRRAEWVRDYTSKAEREERARPPELLAHDSFEQEAGGNGWIGAWMPSTQSPARQVYLTSMDPIPGRIGKPAAAMAIGADVEVRRRLQRSFDPTVRKRIYVAFSVQRLHSDTAEKAASRGATTLMLRSFSDSSSFLAFGLSATNLLVASDNNSWEKSSQAKSGNGPIFIVARIDFRPHLGHQISIAGYDRQDQIPERPPTKWDLVTHRRMTVGSNALDTIALRVLDSRGAKIGNLAIGNAWQAVTDGNQQRQNTK